MRHRTSFFIQIFIVIMFLVIVSGCGYSTSSSLSSSLQTIYVESFENQINFIKDERNQTYFPLLEVKARNAIADRFLFDGNLKISSKETADLVLKGALKNYEKRALRYDDNDDVEEYRVYITVSLEMWNQNEGIMLWQENGFTGEGSYFLTGTLAATEDTAVAEAILDLGRRVVERTIEDW